MVAIALASSDSTTFTRVETLVDTGASHSFMSLDKAKSLGLSIVGKPSNCTIGNSSTVLCIGYAAVVFKHNKDIHEAISVIIMDNLAFDFILGTDFIRKSQGCVNLGTDCLELSLPSNAGPTRVRIPFMQRRTPILADIDAIVPARSEFDIVAAHIADGCDAWREKRRWGIVSCSNFNDGIKSANGLFRVDEKNSSLAVRLVNMTDSPIRIAKGQKIADFCPDLLDVESLCTIDPTLNIANLESGHPPSDAILPFTDAQLSSMDIETLDAEIAKLPHLDDLDLLKANRLSPSGLLEIKRTILKHHRVWSTAPKPPPFGQPQCHIRMKPGKVFDQQAGVVPTNPLTQKYLRDVIEEKLKKNIIEPSNSPCSSRVLLVPKPKGGVRFVIDYRKLNASIEGDAYTLPYIYDQLATLEGKTIFTSLDLKEAFWSVELTEASRELTAFRTPHGLFHYKRMPMGLKTASATFCRFIDSILGSMKWTSILVYIDDLLIATSSEEEHIGVFRTLVERLDKANLTLGAKKCFIGREQVGFLGHVVSARGVEPDPSKIKAIKALHLPESAKEMGTCLGIMGYYRKFVLNYSRIEEPLRKMKLEPHRWKKNKDGKIDWKPNELQAFHKLRECLTKDPILSHPDWTLPFELHTDASHAGLGSVLSQKVGNKETVIAYASRAITKAEAHYSTWELEALAMVWATRHFRLYLYNTHFILRTDSNAAKALLDCNENEAGGRLLRWRLALQDFDYSIHHRKGKLNGNADALSRMYIAMDDPYDDGPTSLDPPFALNCLSAEGSEIKRRWWQEAEKWSELHSLEPFFPPTDSEAWTREEWIALQHSDPLCKKVTSNLANDSKKPVTKEHFELAKDGLLMHRSKSRLRVVVPTSLKAFIMGRYHSLPVTGHKGRRKTFSTISKHYYWKGMGKDVSRWVKSCLTCARRKSPRPLAQAASGIVCNAKRWWQAISIDLVEAGLTSAYIKLRTAKMIET